MVRITRETWLEMGLTVLAQGGPAALTIDALCAAAGKTRGSFYHHFEGIEAFIAALAAHWHRRDTENIIRLSEAGAPDKLEALNALTATLDPALEQGIRQLAGTQQSVREALRATDKRRIGHLVKLHIESGAFAPEEAELLAQITYAAFVGFQQIAPEMPPHASRAAYRRFMAMLARRG